MKVRVLSDLHLECGEPEAIAHADADLVVLAGDIHNHAEGVHWAAQTFEPDTPVVYVPGNHEYYDGEFGALETAMRDAAASVENVHYLNCGSLVDPAGHWRVLGATLWTDFALFGDDETIHAESIAAAEKVMLDFRGPIQVAWSADTSTGHGPARNFTVADSLALHRHASTWLAAEIAKPFAGKTIVVTHHAPHRNSLAAYYANDLASAGFISHLPTLVRPPVALWIHGHTHTAFDYTVDGTRVVCNPRGYTNLRKGRPENPEFAWDKVVEI